MRFGLVSGNINLAGSGRSIVIPLAKALDKAGHEVYLIDVSSGFSSYSIDHETSIRLLKMGSLSTLVRSPWLAAKYLTRTKQLPWMTAHELDRNFNKMELDVIYAFSNSNVLPVLLRVPQRAIIVINLIGFGISPERGGAENTFWIQSEIFSRPIWDLQVCATEFEYQTYQALYKQWRLDPGRLQLLPHSYDDSLFFPCDAAPHGLKRIVYPVAVYPRKNIEMLLQVAAKLANIRSIEVIISGPIVDLSYFNYLTDLVAQLGLSHIVSFLKGRLNTEQLAGVLRRTDLVLFPSFQETFGIGIVESLACGVPVVIPNNIPALRQFNNLRGVHAVNRDATSFFEVARSILDEPCFLNEKMAIAENVRTEFSNTAVARNLVTACQQAIAVRQEVHDLNWSKLYNDESFAELMFQKEKTREST